jgi:hypothetical protein
LEIEEQWSDGRMPEPGEDAVVQQVRQSRHAWLSTSSVVSAISPS